MNLFDTARLSEIDAAGNLWHPDMDAVLPCEDSTFEQAKKAAKTLGFEIKFIDFEEQADENACVEESWNPIPPEGEGWILVAKFNTVECDYYAAFVRPLAPVQPPADTVAVSKMEMTTPPAEGLPEFEGLSIVDVAASIMEVYLLAVDQAGKNEGPAMEQWAKDARATKAALGFLNHLVEIYEKPRLSSLPATPASAASRDVLDERERQKSVEGWTEAHDDEHKGGQMAKAAACYALHAAGREAWSETSYREANPPDGDDGETLWPWFGKWWKPKNSRRDLVRAGALILAEIDRLDRISGGQVVRNEEGGEK